jgi:hypothetical protein
MKTFNKIATAVALSLGFTAVAYAHPGQMGNCTGQNAQQGCQQQMQGNMGQGHMQGMGMNQGGKQTAMGKNQGQGCDGTMNQGARQQTGQQLMTPDERTAMRDKMRNANSPEERQQIAQANHSEMQKRATEKGITLPEYRGPQGRGMGLNATPATTNPVQ